MTAPYTDVEKSYQQSEKLARNRMPHLYRVARLFPDPERYRAFCALYASMRWVDDRVDDKLTDDAGLKRWDREIDDAFSGSATATEFGPALADTLARFDFSDEPWRNLSVSMGYDLHARGFPTYADFRRYAEGATVSPAAIFATLLLMRPSGGRFVPAHPYAKIRDAVRDAAIGCYEVHILRDAREDLEAQRNYFPQDELAAFHLGDRQTVDELWRPYLKSYALRVRGGWHGSMAAMATLEDVMTPRERLMLHLLVEFYGHSLTKIIRLNFNVWSDGHWPEPADVAGLLATIGARYEPDVDLSQLAVRVIEDV
jgi:phytoene/squalene synthetase